MSRRCSRAFESTEGCHRLAGHATTVPDGASPIAARDRLLACLEGRPVDRPPVICPGGMMTMATTSAMRASGAFWPSAHSDPRAMADLVLATQRETGFECLSVPFCMTVEAEVLGCTIDFGTETVLPHVTVEAIQDVGELKRLPTFEPGSSGRAPVVLEALRLLKGEGSSWPVIGAVVGPVSLAAMVMDAGLYLRALRRDPDGTQRLLAVTTEVTLNFALAQHAAGADCVMIAEPSATGEVLGARHFAGFAAPMLARILVALRGSRVPGILHICGDLRPILGPLRELRDAVGGQLAVSVDAMVSGRVLQEGVPRATRVGNIDALLLERGPVERIAAAGRKAALDFDIISPACGLVPTTSPEHLRALVRAVRDKDEA
jgi:MtaA/CmuA family methyltransferase